MWILLCAENGENDTLMKRIGVLECHSSKPEEQVNIEMKGA